MAFPKTGKKNSTCARATIAGRIYRVVPVASDAETSSKRKANEPKSVVNLSARELVDLLGHPNGWWRDAAQMKLVQSGVQSVVPQLNEMAESDKRPLARLHALCTLDGINAMQTDVLLSGLRDSHAGVRRHSVRLAEYVDPSPQLIEQLAKLVDDPDPLVRLQLAGTLGEFSGNAAARVWANCWPGRPTATSAQRRSVRSTK